MTKVKKSNARKSGSSAVSSAMNSSTERKMITAERNGEQRNFPFHLWSHLPEDKEGWKEIQAKPADLSKDKKVDKVLQPSAEDIEITARFKELFEKDPEEGQTIEDLQGLITSRETEIAEEAEMEDFTVDQEFLDTNPERAKEGLKVGAKIKVKKGGDK